VLEIVGLGQACELIDQHLDEYSRHYREMRGLFESKVLAEFPWVKVNGHPEKRLPNTSNISFRGIEANTILSEMAGVAASAGAACHAEQVDVSDVLQAMHVPLDYAMGTIRFSVGRGTSAEEIDQAVEEIKRVVHSLQPDTTAPMLVPEGEEIKLTHTRMVWAAPAIAPAIIGKSPAGLSAGGG
jgi:cysteine sulfinate desulfinase/cysteine desulfurase-like protein